MSSEMKKLQDIELDDSLLEVASGEERIYVATAWQLMRWRFMKHKLAVIALVVLVIMYLAGPVFCEFVAPYDPEQFFPQYKLTPPTKIHIFDVDGNLHMPFVYGIDRTRDPETLRSIYTDDLSMRHQVKLFSPGTTYEMWGLIESNVHLFGLDVDHDVQGVFLLGADRLGRDLFSRVIYGARLSLSIGLIGVFIALLLGIMLGGLSGYYGGWVDNLIQRLIEFIRSIPTIPLWMALSAALPADWPVIRVYFGITVILSLLGWTGLARVVRGRFLSLREEDFVMAATLAGSSEFRVIWRHMVPSFMSYIIANLTLAIPGMIIGETGLSFIGLGLRAPAISWGVLLQESQNLRSLVLAPWVLLPGLFVVLSVLCFNFLGDGLRDAADPYSR